MSVCDYDEFSHGSGECDDGFFTICDEALIEGFEFRVMLCGGHCGHEEGLSEDRPSPSDASICV